jgi:predicted lipoprotein with Yx(FWY)xxD motif
MTTTTEPAVRRPAPGRCGEGRKDRRRAYGRGAVGILVGALLLAAGGSPAGAATPTVQVATNATFGTILVNGAGQALYTLNTDHNGQSTCHGSCAAVWPPLNVPAGTVPTAGPGVGGTVATSRQADGTTQVTYNGSPLYTFVSDTSPGQVTGNNVSGFFVVTAGLTTTTTTAAPPPTTPAPPGSSATPGATPGPSAATAPGSSGSSATPAAPTSPAGGAGTGGTLAFTGAGPGLRWVFVLGLLFVALGSLCVLGWARRRHPEGAGGSR